MKLRKLLCDTREAQYAADGRFEVRNVSNDSRAVKAGGVFFAIKGEHRDGHDFVEKVLKNNAAAVIENPAYMREGCVLVKDTRAAYAFACARFFGRPARSLRLVGITGTNGKTTTAYILRHIFENCGISCGMIGTVENISAGSARASLTTADPRELHRLFAAMKKARRRAAVMEVSSHALTQKRTAALKFAVAVFTNLSHDHLDYHKDMRSYLEAKLLLFKSARRSAVNIDDSAAQRVMSAGGRPFTYSLRDSSADVYVCGGGSPSEVKIKIGSVYGTAAAQPCGEAGMYNTAAAACAALAFGIASKKILRALSEAVSVPGRFQSVESCAPCDIMVDFAHTPAALEKMLAAVREGRAGRVIAVFGCGGDRDSAKRPEMTAASERAADFTVLTTCNPRSEAPDAIIEQARRGFTRENTHVCISDRRLAIEFALRIAHAGDLVVLAGKGHELYQLSADGAHPFDEAAIVQQTAQRLYGSEHGMEEF